MPRGRGERWGLSSNGTILLGKGWGMPVRAKTLPLTPQDRPSMERIKNDSAMGQERSFTSQSSKVGLAFS